ncbi:anti-sigma factor [Variovorax sp. J2P1-59]|uniref:anti-sigma factor family protein n=1 Tax=Variovorax flavidus TaxID=3053501 RepID=UPI0025750890|nr:anti-sigma factor [Variovorax sp. J2P1-59]MDM0076944.1 anti-sigma factor [Variovorax sp. J2P1-59]
MQAPDDDELGLLIRREATRHAPPAALAERILADLRKADVQEPVRRPRRPAAWRWLQAVTLFGAGAATAWGIALSLLVVPAQDLMSESITDSHVRSLMGSHLADVLSSERHTVKPWFAGKLDFSPPVIDLAAEGLPLVGARLDYIGGRPVAALVYQSGQHIINLFVWPASADKPAAPRLLTRRGYNLVHWSEGGMQAWAVSDLNASELQAFATLTRKRMAAPDPPPR